MTKKQSETTQDQKKFLIDISKHFNTDVVSKRQINEFVKINKLVYPKWIFNKHYEESFGKYRVSSSNEQSPNEEVTQVTEKVVSINKTPVHQQVRVALSVTENMIPKKDKTYVPFGFYNDMKMIIESKIFYPIYITGLSGNGKTMMVEQICANLDRELVRVNITKDTDETDLIGSYELIDGNTVRREGPAVIAMRKGAVLLLDETDYGSERLLCLQPILEGKSYLDKKTGEIITPAPGFNIVATANTKGKGSDSGNYIGTNVLNEAFLERFAITEEQQYPPMEVEKQILQRNFSALGIENSKFINTLVTWAEVVRATFNDGGIQDVISTRRLVHIVRAFSIFKNKMKAIQYCLNRFETDTKVAFLDMYTKVDVDAESNVETIGNSDDIPDLSDEERDAIAKNVKAAAGGQPVAPPPAPLPVASCSPPATVPPAAVPPSVGRKVNGSLPSFASIKTLFNTSQKFGEKVEVLVDQNNNDWIVKSHGKSTRVAFESLKSYKEKNDGEILELLVAANLQKKEKGMVESYRPIQ